MRRPRLDSAGALAIVMIACGNGDGLRGSAPPASVASSSVASATVTPPEAPAEASCPFEGGAGCFDGGTVVRCGAAGALVEEPCAAGAACLAGVCSPPTNVGGLPPERSRVRGISPEGWLNGWSVQSGIGAKLRDEIVASQALGKLADGAGAKAVCGADGFVNPRRAVAGEEKSTTAAVLSGTLVSDRARKVGLRAGVSGKLTLSVGGKAIVLSELDGRDGRPLADERFFELELPKGATTVVAVLEPDTGGFYLRLRDDAGRTPNGVAFFEQFPAASCSAASLLDHGAELGLAPDGWHLRARPRFRGLVPTMPEMALGVSVAARGKSEPAGSRPLARASLLASPGSPIDLPLSLPEKGAAEIKLTLFDQTLFTRKLPDDGGLAKRAAKLVQTREATRAKSELPAGSKASFEQLVAVVTKALADGDPDRAWLRRRIEEGEALAQRFDKGEDGYATKRGVVQRAYRSPLDGRLQPYVAYVPPSVDKGKPLPLVMIAHGRDRLPEHALRTLIGEAPDEHMTLSFAARNLPAFPDQGAVLVAPWGFGNAGVLPVGERDLADVVEEMKRAYGIDERKVSLTGYSLGGTVAFVAPLHRPDKFAAAAPLCGYPNLLDYSSVAKVAHLPFEDAMLEKEYIVRYADNGAYVPLHIVHGGKDGPGRSKVVADRYKALRYSHIFDIQEDLDHNVWDYAYEDGKMVPWLKRHSVPEAPKVVELTTGKLRYDRAYWVRIVEMIDSGAKRAHVRAAVAASNIDVTTENVAELELDTARLGVGSNVTVTIDGEKLSVEGPTVLLARTADGKFEVTKDPPQGRKTFGSSGPLDDVQNGPVTIVYGSGDRANREANLLVAQHLATLGGAADVSYPVLADVDATDDALAGRNVILVGSPTNNRLTAAVSELLPVTFEPHALVVRGQRYEGEDLAVSMIVPGPESFSGPGAKKRTAARYVVLHAGVTPRATLAGRMLPRYLPDFVVYDANDMGQRGGLLMDKRKIKAAGFFSEQWQ